MALYFSKRAADEYLEFSDYALPHSTDVPLQIKTTRWVELTVGPILRIRHSRRRRLRRAAAIKRTRVRSAARAGPGDLIDARLTELSYGAVQTLKLGREARVWFFLAYGRIRTRCRRAPRESVVVVGSVDNYTRWQGNPQATLFDESGGGWFPSSVESLSTILNGLMGLPEENLDVERLNTDSADWGQPGYLTAQARSIVMGFNHNSQHPERLPMIGDYGSVLRNARLVGRVEDVLADDRSPTLLVRAILIDT